ncbi:hypothetical protein J6590_024497 [Homalodisca vitripennis]|nr:hypothetical protein J6590_024497 [Homalodisca vitripennis]
MHYTEIKPVVCPGRSWTVTSATLIPGDVTSPVATWNRLTGPRVDSECTVTVSEVTVPWRAGAVRLVVISRTAKGRHRQDSRVKGNLHTLLAVRSDYNRT